MKNILKLLSLSAILISSCESKSIVGYWKATSPTYSKAVKIDKYGNIYTCTLIKSNNTVIQRNNMTLSHNMLMTSYGDFEYIEGNDIILDRATGNPISFIRISDKDWNKEDSLAAASLAAEASRQAQDQQDAVLNRNR